MILLFVLFVIAVAWFRKPKEVLDDRIESIAEVLRPDPISQAVLNGAIDTKSKTAFLKLVASGNGVGEAIRGMKNDKPFFEFKAQMPEIDRAVYFYEVWLIRPIPYNFFSLGEMVTNDEGDFVLEWEGKEEEEVMDYVEIVVTRQEYGKSTDPQMHVVEGRFGN